MYYLFITKKQDLEKYKSDFYRVKSNFFAILPPKKLIIDIL